MKLLLARNFKEQNIGQYKLVDMNNTKKRNQINSIAAH